MSCSGDAETPCCVHSLVVRCGHGARSYYINAPASPPTRGRERVLQVCATSEKPDILNLALDGGPCDQGKPSVSGAPGAGALADNHQEDGFAPLVMVSGRKVSVTASAPARVNTYVADSDDEWSFSKFWRIITDMGKPSESYAIGVGCCRGGDAFQVTVETFVPIQVSGKVTMGFSVPGDFKTKMSREDYAPSFKDTGEFKVTGKLAAKIDGREYSIGQESKDSFNAKPIPSNAMFRSVSFVFEPLIRLLVCLLSDTSSAKLRLPSLEIEMRGELKEEMNSWRVSWQSYLKVALKPLLGVEVTVDIAEKLIRLLGTASSGLTGPCGPIVAEVLIRARNRMRERNKLGLAGPQLDLGIDLIIGGSVEGQFEYWLDYAADPLASGEIAVPVDIKLKGYGKFEVRYWKVTGTANSEIGLRSRFGARMKALIHDRFPGRTGQLFFDGLTAYFSYEVSIGYGKQAAKPGAPPDKGPEPTQTAAGTSDEKTWELVAAAAWPSDPKPAANLQTGDF